jgi:ABC-2 type transport system permease protein
LISVRAQGFQDAYQLGAMVVLPILLLVVGQATGVMYFSTWLVLLLGLVFWVIDAALLWFGGRTFRRSELACRL